MAVKKSTSKTSTTSGGLKVTTDSSGKITGATDSKGSYSVDASGKATQVSSTTSKTSTGAKAPSNPAITAGFMDGSGFDANGNAYDTAGNVTLMKTVPGDTYVDNGVTYQSPARSVPVEPPSVITSAPAVDATVANQKTLNDFLYKNPNVKFGFQDGSGFDASGNPYDTMGQPINPPAAAPAPKPVIPPTLPPDQRIPKEDLAAFKAANPGKQFTEQDYTQWQGASGVRSINDGTQTSVGATTPATGTTPGFMLPTGNAVTDRTATLTKFILDSNKTADILIKTYTTALANYGKTLNKNNDKMIAGIEAQFATRKAAQETLNEATLGGLTVAGERAGRNRYANEMQTGILTAAESEGIQNLADLDAQEQMLILQANTANDEKQFALLDKSMSALMENNKAKQTQMVQLYQFSQQEETIAMQKLRDANSQANENRTYEFNKTKWIEEYNATYNIASKFYQKPGSPTVYDAETHDAVDYATYKARGGVGVPGAAFADVQLIQPKKDYASGIIGEYQFYAEQEVAAGRKPLSFDGYQTMDINRKVSAASRASGGGGGGGGGSGGGSGGGDIASTGDVRTYDLRVKQAAAQVANLANKGYSWGQIASYMQQQEIDPGTPEVNDALHRQFQNQQEYNNWRQEEALLKKGG